MCIFVSDFKIISFRLLMQSNHSKWSRAPHRYKTRRQTAGGWREQISPADSVLREEVVRSRAEIRGLRPRDCTDGGRKRNDSNDVILEPCRLRVCVSFGCEVGETPSHLFYFAQKVQRRRVTLF